MQLLTPVAMPPVFLQLTPSTRVMWMGSCFAQHMGQLLADALPDGHVMGLPHGVLYNPLSIAQSVWRLLHADHRPESEADWCFESADGLWRHWAFSTQTFAPTREQLLRAVQESEKNGQRHLQEADVLLVTLSTDTLYVLADGPLSGQVVANCHKQPAKMFHERRADMEACYAQWSTLIDTLRALRPTLKVVMTLSPYRYVKGGLHENALTKARLLLLIDRLQEAFPETVAYFPAFEIITDELRDYRFYAADMLHPSDQAVGYVWERFSQWAFTPQLSAYAEARGKLLAMERHRPRVMQGLVWEKFEARKEEQRKLVQSLECGETKPTGKRR